MEEASSFHQWAKANIPGVGDSWQRSLLTITMLSMYRFYQSLHGLLKTIKQIDDARYS